MVVTGIGHGTEHKLGSAKLSKHVTWIFLWLCKIIKAGCSHCFQLPTFCRPCQSCTEQKRRPNQQVVMVRWNRKQLQCNWSLHRFNWLNPSISSPTITMTSGKNFLHTFPFVRFKFFDVLYWWPSWKSPSPPFTWILHPSESSTCLKLTHFDLQTKTLMFIIII